MRNKNTTESSMKQRQNRTMIWTERSLVVLLLVVFGAIGLFHIRTYSMFNRLDRLGLAIDISGRQRMLTQKMTKIALKNVMMEQKVSHELTDNATLFNDTLNALIHGGPVEVNLKTGAMRKLGPAINKNTIGRLRLTEQLWTTFFSHITVLATNPQNSDALAYVVNNEVELLAATKEVVTGFSLDYQSELYRMNSQKKWITLAMASFFVIAILIAHFLLSNLKQSLQNQLLQQKELLENAATISETNEQIQAIIDASHDAMIAIDSEGKVTLFSLTAEKMFGLHAEDLLNRPITAIMPAQYCSLHENGVKNFFMTKEPGQFIGNTVEIRALRAGGEEFPAELTLSAAGADDRVFVLGVIRDITKRKQAEEALQHSETKFRTLFESSSDAVMLLDKNGFLDCNNVTLRLFGCENKAVFCTQHPAGLSPAEQPCGRDSRNLANQRIDKAMKKSGSHRFEWVHKRLDTGKTFPAEVLFNRMELDGRLIIQAVVRDVTQRKQAEEELTMAYDVLEERVQVRTAELEGTNTRLLQEINDRKSLEAQLLQAQKMESIGQLAAGIAHEINTPTQYVGDNTRFLKDAFEDIITLLSSHNALVAKAKGIDSLDGEIQDIEAVIQEIDFEFIAEEIPKASEQSLDGIKKISDIVQAMKKFSHSSSEEKTASDVNDGLLNTIIVARNEWKYVADVKTDLDPQLPMVDCHLNELNQVFLNIIVNAAQAIGEETSAQGVEKGEIFLSTRQDGDFVEIQIRDTGPGMPEEIKRRIFDPFFTTKEVGKGTGQGLAIAHMVVVEKHNGTINVESQKGEGTTFVIRLPIDDHDLDD
jgi:two-component system, NtrC family, sensor kinase